MLCPSCRLEVFSQDSMGSANSGRSPWFLIFTSVALFVLAVIFSGVGCSSPTSQDPASYGKYLVIEKIDRKTDSIGKNKAGYWTYIATVKNTGSKTVSEIEGYWQMFDADSHELREKIRVSRLLTPGNSIEITVQVRLGYRINVIESCKVVFEKVKIQEAAKSP